VRSWNDKPTGWYRAFQAQPLGNIRLAGREVAIRARRLRGGRLRDAVTPAYAEKDDTKASEKCVRGFAEPRHHVGAIACTVINRAQGLGSLATAYRIRKPVALVTHLPPHLGL
jgi:hypothetical protein